MTMAETETKPRAVRRGEIATLTGLIESHDAGRTHADLSRDLRGGMSRAQEVAIDEGTAKLTVNITIEVVAASNGRCEVKIKGKVVEPRPSHPTTVLHMGAEGTLSERDPRQIDLPFRKPRSGNNDPSNDGGEGN